MVESSKPAIVLVGDTTPSDVPMLQYKDSVFVALPEDESPFIEIDGQHVLVANKASRLIRELDHWAAGTLPVGARVTSSSWDFCYTHEQVDQWEMPHDCDECRDSVRMAHEKVDEGKWIAFGTLSCEEPADWSRDPGIGEHPCSCGEVRLNNHETITTYEDGVCHRPVVMGPCFVKDYEG